MGICETINAAMKNDAMNEVVREGLAEVLRSSSCEVTEQGTDARGIGRVREVEMGEEVQSLWGS